MAGYPQICQFEEKTLEFDVGPGRTSTFIAAPLVGPKCGGREII